MPLTAFGHSWPKRSAFVCFDRFFFAQAKKDVSQLLGKDKKKRGRPAGKRPTHEPSPEHLQAMPSPSSSIFDRKPLPGIGRQPLQSSDAADHPVVGSPLRKSDNLVLTEKSPSRIQASSLVGHRLSQHLSVSVGSEEGDEKSEDHKYGGGSMKPSSTRAPVPSKEESSTMHDSAAVATGLKSEHDTMLRVSTVIFGATIAETETNTNN